MIRNLANAQKRAIMGPLGKSLGIIKSPAQRFFRASQSLNNEFNVYIDGKAVPVDASYTIYQACTEAGVEIPRFCYHERLSVAGNCRMCLVEVEGSPKPLAACAT